jgi:hypothetical protein
MNLLRAVVRKSIGASSCPVLALSALLAATGCSEPGRTVDEKSDVIVSEFMAANDGGSSNNTNLWYPIFNQVPGTSDDWIEIHNRSADPIDLGGWHLTDDASVESKWTFPAGTVLAGGGFLIVYASSKDSPDPNGNLHTNFKLSAEGEYLALTDRSGGVVSEFASGGSDYPPQNDDVSYGVSPANASPEYFNSPTPGAANEADGGTP